MINSPTVVSFDAARSSTTSAFGGLRGLIDCASRLAGESIDGVLGIVVDASGGNSRRPGAMSLFDARGHCAGSLDGGGLGLALAQAAREVLSSGHASLVVVEAANDSSHAVPGPDEPGGALHILMLPMPARSSPLREAMVGACCSSAWLRLRLELGGSGVAAGFGEARVGIQVFAFDNAGLAVGGSRDFNRHVTLSIAPPPRIALLGGGPESPAITRQAHLLGWYAEVVDARADSVAFTAIQPIDRIHDNAPASLSALLSERHFDAAIIGGHDFEIDLAHLRQLGGCGIGYIGLLGPPQRREALLARVGDIVATQLEPRLYAPAGLRLGGEGPETAALAIIAQLQYYFSYDAHV